MAELGLIFIASIKMLFLLVIALLVLFIAGDICYWIGYLLYCSGRGIVRFGKGKFDPYDYDSNSSGDRKDVVAQCVAIGLAIVSVILCIGLFGISIGIV